MILSSKRKDVRPLVPAITAAHVFVYDHTLLNGRHCIFVDGWIFQVEKKTRGSTALKQCLTEDLILFSNLREILAIQGNLSIQDIC